MPEFEKLRGLVLSGVRYGETSLIVHIYTDRLGRQSFMVNGAARKGKRPGKLALFQPLSMLTIVASLPRKGSLLRIQEVASPSSGLYTNSDLRKGAIAVFLAEVLHKTLREEEPNPELFDFLWNSVELLDAAENGIANFHLVFMAQLSRYLGFYPVVAADDSSAIFFDIKNGRFQDTLPAHPIVLPEQLSRLMLQVFQTSLSGIDQLQLNRDLRNLLADGLVDYYQHHHEGVGNIKSLAVLKEVFA
ncbi:MAG TPA: DNA repair protein RecO [Williamwhitmania sp.]|nr:DNA repair protein RecO [Williamwhitmania sp.]